MRVFFSPEFCAVLLSGVSFSVFRHSEWISCISSSPPPPHPSSRGRCVITFLQMLKTAALIKPSWTQYLTTSVCRCTSTRLFAVTMLLLWLVCDDARTLWKLEEETAYKWTDSSSANNFTCWIVILSRMRGSLSVTCKTRRVKVCVRRFYTSEAISSAVHCIGDCDILGCCELLAVRLFVSEITCNASTINVKFTFQFSH